MKTPEDEAFDDLARKQGAWGGGFPAKRAMAADKLQEPDWKTMPPKDAPLVQWAKEQKTTPPLPVQEPVCDKDPQGCWNVRCQLGKQCKNLAQPAQEPVAWTLLLTGEHHGIIGAAGEKFIGAPEYYKRVDVYTTPPQREWVELTRAEFAEILCDDRWQGRPELMMLQVQAKLKEKNNG